MTDITMCLGEGCPLRKKCYRYNAPKGDIWQSYIHVPPFREEDGKTVCDLFWLDRRKPHEKKERTNG